MPIDYSRIHDFSYYAPTFLKIKSERMKSVVPFRFNIEQEKLHRIWDWQLNQTGMVRLIILKDRRIGVSTYVDGRAFHQTATTPNTMSFVITHDKDSLGKIFGMSKLFYDCLPANIRPKTRYNNSTKLVFENPDKKTRFAQPGLRSLMEVFSANTGTASRSGGYSIAHFSEVAFYQDAQTLITSTVPAIPDVPGTIKVYESTGNGRQGFFYDQWRKAKESLRATRKTSNYLPVFFGWLTFPDYIRTFRTDEERKDLLGTLDEEETYIQTKFKATPEQLNWRRYQINEFSGDVDQFRQEFPCDDEEAFISKGIPYFPKRLLLKLATGCRPPLVKGEITELGFTENENGQLSIWERPIRGYEYALAADVGEGLSESDPSTIEVIRVPRDGDPRLTQVAEWRGLIDPVQFAAVIAALGRWYNEALVAPETNNHGFATLAELKQIYYNIYQWQYFDRFKHYQTEKLGWQTSAGTKPLLCTYTLACLNADVLVVRSEALVDEMLKFVRNLTGSGEADYNCHDDLVMAYMIALFTMGKSFPLGSLLQQLGMFRESEGRNKLAKLARPGRLDHDLELDRLDWEVDQVGASDNAWLNY